MDQKIKVRELKAGSKFRIEKTRYQLLRRPTDCSSYVQDLDKGAKFTISSFSLVEEILK